MTGEKLYVLRGRKGVVMYGLVNCMGDWLILETVYEKEANLYYLSEARAAKKILARFEILVDIEEYNPRGNTAAEIMMEKRKIERFIKTTGYVLLQTA